MDEQNPAVTRQTQIPPALLEEVANDPRALEAWCRKLYLVGVDKVQRQMKADTTISLGQRLAWLDHLAKYGGLGQARNQPAASGSGFSVNIVLNNNAPSPKPRAVDVVDVTVEDSSS